MTATAKPSQLGATLAVLLLVASSLAAAQSLYRYVDPDGRVVYTDKPPPPNAKDAQSKRVGHNTIETGSLSYSAQLAQERFPVTLYSFDCGVVCESAQALLNKRGVPHTVINISQNDGAEKLKRLTGGLDAPVLQVGTQYATGFNEAKWQGLLTDAGYPKTPPPRTNPVGRGTPSVTAPSTPTAAQAATPNAASPPAPNAAAPGAAPSTASPPSTPSATPKGSYPQQ